MLGVKLRLNMGYSDHSWYDILYPRTFFGSPRTRKVSAGHVGRTLVFVPPEVTSSVARSRSVPHKASDARVDCITDDNNSKCVVVGYFVYDRKSLQTLFCAAQSLDT